MKAILLVTMVLGLATTQALASGDAPRLVAARELVEKIDQAHNEYSYKDPYVRWKGFDGADAYEAHCDCSAFIDALEMHADRLSPDDLLRLTGFKHPHAHQWYDAIIKSTKGEALQRIDHLSDALPGDFLVTAYPPQEATKDTGHIMLLDGMPTRRTASRPIIDGTIQWDVPVIDSSKSFHGNTDTRHHADETQSSGVGKGILRLYTNPDKTIAGYAWSDSAKSVYIPRSQHPFAIARLDAEKAKGGK